LPHDGNGIVRRKIVAVVGESNEAEGIDQAVRGIYRHNIDLMIDEGAIDEAEIHDFG